MSEDNGRHSGVRLNRERLDYELGRRGLTDRQFAELSGVPATTLSHARHGHYVRQSTLYRIAKALDSLPEMPGAALLISPPS